MLICDTHADSLYAMAKGRTGLDVTLDILKKAGVSLQTMALFVGGSEDRDVIHRHYQQMMEKRDLLLKEGWVQVDDPRDAKDGESRFMLSIEGCEILEDGIDTIELWRSHGVRMAAITWNYENKLASPAAHGNNNGLSSYGKDAVREMVRVGIAPDVSHLNERGFWDLLEMGVVPLASHSCAKKLCNHFRNLTDDQLTELFKAGGYVGVNFYPSFLNESGKATMDELCDHFIHMMECGGEKQVGFGSDFDGIETKVPGLENPLGLDALMKQLKKRGLTDAEIEGIAGKNLLAYYDRVFPRA